MENPCKPPIEEKLYSCPRLVETNVKSDSPRTEVRQVECGRLFGSKKSQDAPLPPPPSPESMSPPPYSDLGKKAKDVFNKGYHFGLVKLDIKTKSSSGVEFNTVGSSNQESGKVSGSLETKYNVKDFGLTFTEKWTTDNNLTTEFAVQDQFVPGLKLSSALTFAPQTGGLYHIQGSNLNVEFNTEQEWGKVETKGVWRPLQKTGNVKAAYINNQVALNADSDFTADGPKVTASAVVGYQGWLAGYLAGYDINNKKLTKSNVALGFTSGDFTLHSNVDLLGAAEEGEGEGEGEADDGGSKGFKLGGSIFHQINPQLEYGIMLDWSNEGGGGGDNGEGGEGSEGSEGGEGEKEKKEGEEEKKEGENGASSFAVACQYQLDPDASIRFKIDNNIQVGLGYQQRLREGISIWLSALIDGKNLDQGGGHKVGLGLELEA